MLSPPVRRSHQEGPSGEQLAEPVGGRPDADAEGDAAQRGREEGTQVEPLACHCRHGDPSKSVL